MLSGAIGGVLVSIRGSANSWRDALRLLYDVCQFVRQQTLALVGPGSVLALAEDDIATRGVGSGVESPRGFSRIGICVDPDIAQVPAIGGLSFRPR
jgi:hypothetical protein